MRQGCTGEEFRALRIAAGLKPGRLAFEMGVQRRSIYRYQAMARVPRLVEMALRGVLLSRASLPPSPITSILASLTSQPKGIFQNAQ